MLSDAGGDGGACDAQFRRTQKPENQDRVQDQVDHCSGNLGDHAEVGQACGLKQTLEGHLIEEPQGETGNIVQVRGAVCDDFPVIGLGGHKPAGAENAK